ncbi:MAG: WD40 repeat domain-containing protein [Epsilonproteobacteria bacterium]|nr:WD40 repeat domain-containing protein [Campylobacterota bacterium]
MNKKYLLLDRNLFIVLAAFIISTTSCVQALVVGSDSAFSREGTAIFPQADSNNTLKGFARFEQGFSLEDNATTCTYDNFLPVSGAVKLNRGHLYLLQDLVFTNSFGLSNPGFIHGNDHAVVLGKQQEEVLIPTLSSSFLLNVIDTKSMDSKVHSVDWNKDDQYVSAGANATGSGPEFKIYYFDGSMLTPTQSKEMGKTVWNTRWHPSKNFVAIGAQSGSGDELFVYELKIHNGTLVEKDSRSFGAQSVYDTEWHPSGAYLVAGSSAGTDELRLYSVNQTTGALTDLSTTDLSPSRSVNSGGLAWSPGGSHLAVGTTEDVSADELLVYTFNGTSLTLSADVNIDESVESLDWSPTGSYIAVGLDGSSTRVRVYEYDPVGQTLTLVESVSESRLIEEVHWDPTGNYLLVGIDSGISSEVSLYYFDKDAKTLSEINELASLSDIEAIRWSRSGDYAAWGKDNDDVVVAGLGKGVYYFEDTVLMLNSDARVRCDMYFSGTCCVMGNGKQLAVNNGATMFVRPGAYVTFQDIILDEFGRDKLACMSDDGDIRFKNARLVLSDNYSFSKGAFSIHDGVEITGTQVFAYSAARTSTVYSLATLLFDRDTTFSYDPRRARADLIYFEDASSMLVLNGCTLHSTHTGLCLQDGMVIFDDKVTVSSESRTFSEDMVLKSSLDIRVLGGALLDVFGRVRYE